MNLIKVIIFSLLLKIFLCQYSQGIYFSEQFTFNYKRIKGDNGNNLLIETNGDFIKEDIIIKRQNETTKIYENIQFNRTSKSLIFNSEQLPITNFKIENYLMNIPQNSIGQILYVSLLDKNNQTIRKQQMIQSIVSDQKQNEEFQIFIQSKEDDNTYAGVLVQSIPNKIFKKQCNDCNNITIKLEVFYYPYLNGTNNIIPYENEIDTKFDGENIVLKKYTKEIIKTSTYTNATYQLVIDYQKIPDSFKIIQFSLRNYQFEKINYYFQSFGISLKKIINSNNIGPYISTNIVQNALILPYYSYNPTWNDLINAHASIIQIDFYLQPQWSCRLIQLTIPQIFQKQINGNDQVYFYYKLDSDNQLRGNIVKYNNITGAYTFRDFSFSFENQYRYLILSSFSSPYLEELSIELQMKCDNFDPLIIKNISISQNTKDKIGSSINQISMIFDDRDEKYFELQFSIKNITNIDSVLLLQMPLQLYFTDNDINNVDIFGFIFSSYKWDQNNILFENTTFNSNQIHLKFKQVKLKQNKNIKWIINIRCFNKRQFIFYTTESTVQDLQILETKIDLPTDLTTLLVKTFQLRKPFPNDQILENRTLVPSSLFIQFDVTRFTDSCAWIIFTVPQDIVIGRIENPLVSFQDCQNQQHSYQSSNDDQSKQVILINKNSNNIFFSCKYLKSIATLTQIGSEQILQCLNNTVSIQHTENPQEQKLTNNLTLYFANLKTPDQTDDSPPIQFNPQTYNQQQNYAYQAYETQSFTGIYIEQEFEPIHLSLQAISNFTYDVTTYNLSFILPIYLHKEDYQVKVKLPIKYLGSNPTKDILCGPTPDYEGQLASQVVNQISIEINVHSLLQPGFLFNCVFANSARINQTDLSINQLEEDSSLNMLFIQVYQEGKLLSEIQKNLNMSGSQPLSEWIYIAKYDPLTLSSYYMGQIGAEYTFSFDQIILPESNDQQQRFIEIQIDNSLMISEQTKCFLIIFSKDIPENLKEFKLEVNCQIIQPNILLLPSQALFSIKQPFKIQLSSIRNPIQDIGSSNKINLKLKFQFSYIWQRSLGIEEQTHYITQTQFSIDIFFNCNSSCQGCTQNYQNCIKCSSEFKLQQIKGNRKECVKKCDQLQAIIGNECTNCQVLEQNCSTCSSENLKQCNGCSEGYIYIQKWQSCVDQSLFPRRILITQNYENEEKIENTKSDVLQYEPNKNHDNFRLIQENSSSDKDQVINKEQNQNSQLLNKFQESLEGLKSGKIIFLYFICSAAAFSIFLNTLQEIFKKWKVSHQYVNNNSDQNKSKNPTQNQNIDQFNNHNIQIKEILEQIYSYRYTSLMLFILSVTEIIQIPYILFWGLAISDSNLAHPVMQTLIGTCALSGISWIFDSYQLGFILANKNNTPKNSCIFNPLPLSKREGLLSFTIIITRIIFSLVPKSVCITLSNAFNINGWFCYPYFEDQGRSSVLLTNLRKILGQQIKCNIAGITAFITLLNLQYPEIMESFTLIYDIIIFNIIMAILCFFNIRTIDSILLKLHELTENS
uniref:MTAXp n=1 Tax=Tetrahymena borealis TaxID=5893 RepID=A0A513X5A0_TETBO|nr:MTAXp [Tetrahymena borealis]